MYSAITTISSVVVVLALVKVSDFLTSGLTLVNTVLCLYKKLYLIIVLRHKAIYTVLTCGMESWPYKCITVV